MKDTIEGIVGWTIIGCIGIGSFVAGYITAENKHLRGNIDIMASLMDLVVEIGKVNKNKEKVPEEKTEE